MGLRAPKGPQQPSIGNESLDAYFPKSPEQEQKMLQQMLEKQMVEGIAKQKENEAMQREMLQKALGLSPKNLNPDVEALQQALQKTSAGITDDEINLLRSKLAAKQGESESRKANQYLTTKDYDAFKNVKTAFDKPREDLNSFYQSYDVMQGALASKDVYQLQNALSNFARLAGEKGVLTDQDIVRVVPSNLKMKTAQALAFLRSDPSYEVPKEVLEAVGKASDRLRESAEIKYKGQLAQQKEAFQQGPLSFPKYARELYGAGEKAIRPKATEAAPQEGEMMNEDQFIKKFLEAKKNAGK